MNFFSFNDKLSKEFIEFEEIINKCVVIDYK